MNANKYLQDIGLENVIDEEFFNDDDKSWYKVQELMESYHQAKLKLLGIADVVGQSEQFNCLSENYAKEIKRCSEWCGEDICQKPRN